MKKFFNLAVAMSVIASSLFFASCGEDEDEEETPKQEQNNNNDNQGNNENQGNKPVGEAKTSITAVVGDTYSISNSKLGISGVSMSIDAVSEPFTTAIKEAIKKGFLSDYLNRKSTEVQNMLLAEYDYDTDIAVQRREAREEGISIGLSQGAQQKAVETAKNALTMNLSIEQVATLTGLSVEEIEKL